MGRRLAALSRATAQVVERSQEASSTGVFGLSR
jgi:hypothetical protein